MNPIAMVLPLAAAAAAYLGYQKFVAKSTPGGGGAPVTVFPNRAQALDVPKTSNVAVGDVLLVSTVQPNGSQADMNVEVTGILGQGLYSVAGRPDIDGYDPSWGLVYPAKIGDGDIIRRSGKTSVSGMGGIGADPVVRRRRARQAATARRLGR